MVAGRGQRGGIAEGWNGGDCRQGWEIMLSNNPKCWTAQWKKYVSEMDFRHRALGGNAKCLRRGAVDW